jgi:hypothetical protein
MHLKDYQEDVYLIIKQYEQDDYGNTIEKDSDDWEEVLIDNAVIVQPTATTVSWSPSGDYTGGFSELYIKLEELDEKGITIDQGNTFVRQGSDEYRIKVFTEYKEIEVGIYSLERVDDSLANI